MTLREKIGQLMMVGFEGTDLSVEFKAWLREYQPGGIILFSRNLVDPIQVGHLTQSLQEHAPGSPFLIAIDQEGGRVSRLPKGFTIFPPASTISACGSADLAYQAAAVTADELRAVGINMNMAPVLDVNTNPANPIIGDRAFGENAEAVCELGVATMAGLQDHHVVACGKHFPGHGETETDSHLELPIVHLGKDRLETVELEPFRHAIRKGLASIMTAHVRYPALDGQVPATLSSVILTELLRGRLGFDGLVLTDDLEMNAIVDHLSIGEAAVRSFQAGADILLICHKQSRQQEAIEAMEQAVKEGAIPMSRLDASLTRLSRIKGRFQVPAGNSDPQRIQAVVGNSSHRTVLERIRSHTSVT